MYVYNGMFPRICRRVPTAESAATSAGHPAAYSRGARAGMCDSVSSRACPVRSGRRPRLASPQSVHPRIHTTHTRELHIIFIYTRKLFSIAPRSPRNAFADTLTTLAADSLSEHAHAQRDSLAIPPADSASPFLPIPPPILSLSSERVD